MNESIGEERFYFVGNALFLDFINTEVIAEGRRTDLLRNNAYFADWLLQAGILDATSVHLIPVVDTAMLPEVRAFRAVLRRMAETIAVGETVPSTTVAEINVWMARLKKILTLEQTETGYVKVARPRWESGLDVLAPIAESAADLLASGDLHLLRKCENPQCILYFYDTTKNHARRWCSMSGCGNRHKVAEHYKRKRMQVG